MPMRSHPKKGSSSAKKNGDLNTPREMAPCSHDVSCGAEGAAFNREFLGIGGLAKETKSIMLLFIINGLLEIESRGKLRSDVRPHALT